MKRSMRLVLSLFCGVLLSGAAFAEDAAIVPLTPETASSFRQQVQEVTPKAVIDPLTFTDQDGVVYRLAGIDVPDLFVPEPPALAGQARDRVEEWLKNAKVKIHQTKNAQKGRTNRMGQLLVHAARSRDGLWLQGSLVAEGLARVYPTSDNPEGLDALLAHEDAARKAGKGLWAVPDYAVLTPENASAGQGKFAVVRGVLRGVSAQSNMLFLNFGPDWRSDFTVGVSPAMRRAFAKKQIDLQAYAGREIEVRGMIGSYYGPFINLADPAQLRLAPGEEDAEDEPEPKPEAAPVQPETKALHTLKVAPMPDDAPGKALDE